MARIEGARAWSAFLGEPGNHVVQRIPPTEKRGRRHTSTVTVAVLPLASGVRVELADTEIRTKTQGGHGKGGQHQNKRDSAVRMQHLPTGIEVFINGRDQHQNRRLARKVLTERVNAQRAGATRAKQDAGRRAQIGSGSRGKKVRTYNFIDSRVVDHASGRRTHRIDQVMRGRFDLVRADGDRGPPEC